MYRASVSTPRQRILIVDCIQVEQRLTFATVVAPFRKLDNKWNKSACLS